MWFFKKKTKETLNTADRDLIATNSKLIDVLLALSGDEGYTDELKALQEKLKYLIPSENEKIYICDKKIKGKIEDAKILLTKADDKHSEKVKAAIDEINVCVAERNVYLD